MELGVHITNFSMLSYQLTGLESPQSICCAEGAMLVRFKSSFHFSRKLSLLLLLPCVSLQD